MRQLAGDNGPSDELGERSYAGLPEREPSTAGDRAEDFDRPDDFSRRKSCRTAWQPQTRRLSCSLPLPEKVLDQDWERGRGQNVSFFSPLFFFFPPAPATR